MKKLNRKGFTLVELLAVIIILAIVIGISIPAVLTTTNNAKVKAGKAAALAVSDWAERQYQVILTGLDTAGIAKIDANFKSQCGADGASCKCTLSGSSSQCPTAMKKTITDNSFIAAAGMQKNNITSIGVNINPTTGKVCVLLTIPTTSDYYFSGATTCQTGETNCYVSATTIKAGAC